MPEDSTNAVRGETRRLAAIMFTDIVGFSRQMGADEARMLRLLDLHHHIVQHAVEEHQGQIVKSTGDGFLVEFPSVVNAVRCAQQLQTRFHTYNVNKAHAEQIHLRIGIHLGDIVQQHGDVQGDGVNIAARLQALAEPDTICISDMVYRDVAKKLDLGSVVALGRPKLKNIAERFQVYTLLPESPTGLRRTLHVQRVKLKHHKQLWQVAAAVLAVSMVSAGLFLLKSRSFPLAQQSSPPDAPSPASPSLPLPDKPSLIVLPFVNMSQDPAQEYFSDGLTETLTGALSKISSLFVIARNSAFTYKGKAVNVQDAGREMGVRYVLEGSVQKADQRIRITTQLIDASTGYHLWSEQYDRPLADLFALQDDIVQKIVTTLKLQLTLQEQGWIVRKWTNNLEAYDAFLRGVDYFSRYTKGAEAQARQMYEKAIALDPQYADAYAWLSYTYWREWVNRLSTDPQTLERALALVQQALTLDDSLPIAHSLLGYVYAQKQQYEQALAEEERAIALDPNNADSYARQADVLNNAGRFTDALRSMEQAMRLNPRYPFWYLVELGVAYHSTGRYAEAIAVLQEAIDRNPNHLLAQGALVHAYLMQWLSQQRPAAQTLAPAVAAGQRAVALNADWYFSHITLGYLLLYQRQYEQALVEMERAVALAPTEAWSSAARAEVLSAMGRTEEALEAAAQALRLQPAGSTPFAEFHLGSVGPAYAVAGHYEEARAPLQRFLSRYPNTLPVHLMLAAVYSELGQAAEARAEAAEVLRLNPQFSLEVHKQRMPIKDPAVLESVS
jgi:adenylate cyclase